MNIDDAPAVSLQKHRAYQSHIAGKANQTDAEGVHTVGDLLLKICLAGVGLRVETECLHAESLTALKYLCSWHVAHQK